MADGSLSLIDQAEQVTDPDDASVLAAEDDDAVVAGELLVEEISIDGMCGVY